MAQTLEALARCDRYRIPPAEGFANQFQIGPADAPDLPGMTTLVVNKWAVRHGPRVPVIPMFDEKGRPYGAFIGIGVDGDGAVVDAARLAAFNSKGRSFEADFDDYLAQVAGRYLVLLDAGTKTRVYADPMGHLALFYNPATRLAGSSLFLTLDRDVVPDPVSSKPGETAADTVAVLPLGRTPDRDVRLLWGQHRLDLAGFVAERVWPLRNTLRPVTAAKAGPVIERMARRLAQVTNALAQAGPAILPLDGGAGARMVLAALDQAGRGALREVYTIDWTGTDTTGDTHIASGLCAAAGLTHAVLDKHSAIARFGRDREARQHRKRLYWLRTSCVTHAPREATANLVSLRPGGPMVLDSLGAEALQGGWQPAQTPVPEPDVAAGKANAIAFAIRGPAEVGATDDQAGGLESDWAAWSASLPKTLQPRIADFIRIELHQPAQAVALYGSAENFTVSPFSDRALIELALKLPADLRVGPDLCEALIAALDPALAGKPYRGDLTLANAAE